MNLTYHDLSHMFDHALLLPTLTETQLNQGLELAIEFEVASVCIHPFFMRACASALSGSEVVPSTVIGFPHGTVSSTSKRYEAEVAIERGGRELDMVVNISQVLSGNWEAVRDEILAVVLPAQAKNRRVKVIFENCYLNDDQKKRLCEICSDLKVDWVKTSTGFGTGGATLADVELMRKYSAETVQVKASGGIRTLEEVLAFRQAGATRIGTSKTAELLNEWRTRLGLPLINVPTAAPQSGFSS